MTIPAGTYRYGPDNATLAVRTGRTGAASKAGHDLLFHVGTWQATLTVGDGAAGTTVELTADSSSLRVIEGTGGIQSLGDGDKAEIVQTVDKEVLKRQPVAFRSTSVQAAGDGLRVEGELTLHGTTAPLAVDVAVADDGGLSAVAAVKQTDWKIKPYSTLFGALKVADEVRVTLEAPGSQSV